MRRVLRQRLLTAIALAAGISTVASSQQYGTAVTSATSQVMHKPEEAAPLVKDNASRAARAEASSQDSMMDADIPAGPVRNAFERENWNVPAAPRPPIATVTVRQVLQAPLPPPVPVAPPVPFRFMGRYDESGDPVFFLTAGERLLLVHSGDVIDGTYRVEGMVGDELGITYLPLSIKQSLNAGGEGSPNSENHLSDRAVSTAPQATMPGD
jgi:hypothetical protein